MNTIFFLIGVGDALLGFIYLLAKQYTIGWIFLFAALAMSFSIKEEKPND